MHNMTINMHKCVSKQSSMTKQIIVTRQRRVHPVLLWALSVLVLISGVLQAKPNEAPEAAAHTEFGLGIKSRMIGESTEMMVMEYDIF